MPFTLNDIEIVYAPAMQTLPEAALSLGLSRIEERMFARFYGLRQFPHDDSQTLGALIAPALSNIVRRHATIADKIRLCVHCHTIPSLTPFDFPLLPELVRQTLGDGVEYASYTMSHCATGLVALDQISSWLGEDEYALVIIAEKAFHPKVQLIANTTIMGEAACVLLLSTRAGPLRVIDTLTTRDGRFSINSGHLTGQSTTLFQQTYTDFVCGHICAALRRCDLPLDALAFIAPHNVNTASWREIARQLDINDGKILLQNIPQYGHCFGADPFINLDDLLRQEKIKPGDKVLLISVGLGATAASALIEYQPAPD